MSFKRQYTIKHYTGSAAGLPATLPAGDFYFDEDNNILYKYDETGVPIAVGNGSSGSGTSTPKLFDLKTDGVIFIGLTGQSNADGRALNTDIPAEDIKDYTNFKIWNSSTELYDNYNPSSSGATQHNVLLYLAKWFEENYPLLTVYSANYAVGGTGISDHQTGGVVYDEFKTNHFDKGINWILDNNLKPFPILLFYQGEFDSNTNNTAVAYETELNNWLNLWQSEVGVKLPVLDAMIVETDTDDEIINDSKISVYNGRLNYEVLDNTGHTSPDNLHYDYEDFQTVIGPRTIDWFESIEILHEIKKQIGSVVVDIITPGTFTPTEETSPFALWFNNDGSKMYIIGTTNNRIQEYDLATSWDATSQTHVGSSDVFSDIRGGKWNSDGTKLYLIDAVLFRLYEYDATTPYSTASGNLVLNGQFSFGISSTIGFDINADFTKLFVIVQVSGTNDIIKSYTFGTPGSVITLTDDSIDFDIQAVTSESAFQDLYMNPDGSQLYAVGFTTDTVYRIEMASANNLSTASYSSNSLDISTKDATARALYFRSDGVGDSNGGLTYYIVGSNNDRVEQDNLTTPWDLTI